jgi:hypothetical protein
MAWSKEGRAQRILQRFHDAILAKETTWHEYLKNPTPENHATKMKALQRYNMLRGTLYRIIMSSSEEL